MSVKLTKARDLWAVKIEAVNQLDGYRAHFDNDNCLPKLFTTRAEARAWAREKYGYIAERPDLRQEPHGWRVPQAVRVRVQIEEQPAGRSLLQGGDDGR